MATPEDLYNELAFYSLAHSDPAFIHQHVVDAFGAQYADEDTKPIQIVFSLIGLYLYLEKNSSGRQVQSAHMRLAKRRQEWPSLPAPRNRGEITASNVLAAPPGSARDAMIQSWCESVWAAWIDCRHQIIALARNELDIH